MQIQRISLLGLGKIGAPLAACLAGRGFDVIGVDRDQQKVAAVNKGLAPIYEPGLQEMIERAGGRLRATSVADEAVLSTEATFVVVPTPSESDGRFSLDLVLPAIEVIGNALRRKEEFHLVVIGSTVTPGSLTTRVIPTIERVSGRKVGQDVGVCYCPEFVALGDTIHGLLNPDLFLVGQSDEHSGDALVLILTRLAENDPPIARMSFVNAEIAKLAVNTFVTSKIAFANMLAAICEHQPDADIDAVTSALGLDSRIGPTYLKGALGYGGPCFPRDNIALATYARELGIPPLLPEATNAANKERLREVLAIARSRTPADGTVAVLGLSYKPKTNVVEESSGLALARGLAQDGVSVLGYDPAAGEAARQELEGLVTIAGSLEACVANADVIVVAVPWEEFTTLGDRLPRDARPRTVIDCWRMLDPTTLATSVAYVPLGVGQATTGGGQSGMISSAPASKSLGGRAEPVLED